MRSIHSRPEHIVCAAPAVRSGTNLLGGLGFDPDGDIRPDIQSVLLQLGDGQAVVAFGLRFF